MKCSDAIVSGDSLRSRNSCTYLGRDSNGRWCGCAIGGALLAVGKTDENARTEVWPWLEERTAGYMRFDLLIGLKFFSVSAGHITMEQLVDYVKSVEPECGECNQFECTCIKVSDGAEGVIEEEFQAV